MSLLPDYTVETDCRDSIGNIRTDRAGSSILKEAVEAANRGLVGRGGQGMPPRQEWELQW